MERTIYSKTNLKVIKTDNIEVSKYKNNHGFKVRETMPETKELSNITKSVKEKLRNITHLNVASTDILSDEEYSFLLNESVRLINNPELDVTIRELTDNDYGKRIGAFEAGSTQKVSSAIRSKLKKEILKARQYVKAIEETIELETQLENRNHRRNLGYRVINTFAIYGTIILTSMIAHYGLGVNLALVKFDSKSEVENCVQMEINREQINSMLSAINDKDIANYVEKKLIKKCLTTS